MTTKMKSEKQKNQIKKGHAVTQAVTVELLKRIGKANCSRAKMQPKLLFPSTLVSATQMAPWIKTLMTKLRVT